MPFYFIAGNAAGVPFYFIAGNEVKSGAAAEASTCVPFYFIAGNEVKSGAAVLSDHTIIKLSNVKLAELRWL